MDSVSAAQSLADKEPVSVGKYKLIANLGRGGMADVFLAVVAGPLGVNKLQVVKRLRAEFAEDPERLEMFLDEARIATRLNHPNVVQTFEVHAEKGSYFITMEYLEGAPLNRLVNRARTKTPPPPGVLLRILADVLAGLHYSHELCDYDGKPLNIVHRDVSPHNVIVSYDGQAKLLDFGIAKSDVRMMETRTGMMKGKLGYMAPEQVRCRPLDRRADVFVAGIVLWETLAGRKMWDSKAPDMEVLHKLATGDLQPIESVRPDVAPELAAICAKALSYDPVNRYSTAAEMRAAILAYLDASGLWVTPEDIGKYVATVYADKRAEIRKVIERQLAKLRQHEGASTAAEEMPASSMRVMRVDGPHDGSGHSSSSLLPNLRSMPPSMEAPDALGPSIPPPPALPAMASMEPSPVTPTLDRRPGTKTDPPAPRTKEKTPAQAAAELVEVAPESTRGSDQTRLVVALVVVLAAAVGAFVALRFRQTHAPPPPPAAVTAPQKATGPGPVSPATTTTPRK
jgi:eukaryotic-like serine/threonine-protein kinase